MSSSIFQFPPPSPLPPRIHHFHFVHSHPASNAPLDAPPIDLDGFDDYPWALVNSTQAEHPITLMDIHGVLMVIAWLGLIPGAIFSARYLRQSWPDKSLFGLKLWFQIHRTLNFFAVLLIVISTLLAFYCRGKWTGPWFGRDAKMKMGYGAWHSLFGIFAIILAVRQPFNALLRCAPDHPRRPLFNWMHRIAGLVAYLLAMVPLFIGVFVRPILHRRISEWILISYHVALFLLILAAEFVNWLDARSQQRRLLVNEEDDGFGDEGCALEENENRRKHFLRNSIFALLLFASISCSTLLALFILMHG